MVDQCMISVRACMSIPDMVDQNFMCIVMVELDARLASDDLRSYIIRSIRSRRSTKPSYYYCTNSMNPLHYIILPTYSVLVEMPVNIVRSHLMSLSQWYI